MQRRVLKVTDYYKFQKDGVTYYTLRGNGIRFADKIEGPITPATLGALNERFRNSLRYVKHYAGYPERTAQESDMAKMLDGLSQTDTGFGIRIKNDPVKEFTPFQ